MESETYRIAVLDYLGFHTNSSRYYNSVPSADGNYIGKAGKNYRELLRDWLIDNGYSTGKALVPNGLKDSWNYDRSGITVEG